MLSVNVTGREDETILNNGLFFCKKCKEHFHPSWLEDHKLQHEGKGMFGGSPN